MSETDKEDQIPTRGDWFQLQGDVRFCHRRINETEVELNHLQDAVIEQWRACQWIVTLIRRFARQFESLAESCELQSDEADNVAEDQD
ncbi:MAG: hypothetical protein QGG36_04420 [Pirellulaceae bacterium]|nr:hypothetical protein [Pirellulaceae bacterium]MDP7015015.1 hypothetical protein [Pirellulaceae bacterium]